MRTLVIIIFLLAFTSQVQAQWQPISGTQSFSLNIQEFDGAYYGLANGRIYKSSEGKVWEIMTTNLPDGNIMAFTANDDAIWVSINTGERIYYSTDGMNFTGDDEGIEGINFIFTLTGEGDELFAYLAAEGSLYFKPSLNEPWQKQSVPGAAGRMLTFMKSGDFVLGYGDNVNGGHFKVSEDNGKTFANVGKTDSVGFPANITFPNININQLREVSDSLYIMTNAQRQSFSLHLKDSLWKPITYKVNDNTQYQLQSIYTYDGEIYAGVADSAIVRISPNLKDFTVIGQNYPTPYIAPSYFYRFNDGSFRVFNTFLENEKAEYSLIENDGINETFNDIYSDGNLLYTTGYNPFEYYSSADFGDTWNKMTSPNHSPDPTRANIVSSINVGAILFYTFSDGSETGELFITEDAGQNWEELILTEDVPQNQMHSHKIIKNNDVYILSFIYRDEASNTKLAIYNSNDLEITTDDLVGTYDYSYLEDVKLNGSNIVFQVSDESGNNFAMMSENNGSSWSEKAITDESGSAVYPEALSLLNNSTLLALTTQRQNYTIYKSEDKGENWVPLTEGSFPSDTPETLTQINNDIYLITTRGAVYTVGISDETLTEVQTVVFPLVSYAINHIFAGNSIIRDNTHRFELSHTPSSNEQSLYTPNAIVLHQNYPNPFNPTTTISFQLPETQDITLKVYDMLGREVMALAENSRYTSGTHNLSIDASDLSSGMYMYRLVGTNFMQTRKMTLIK